MRGFVAVFFSVCLTCPVALAQTAPSPPSDPIEAAAFDALDKNCSRCHQTGKLVAGKANKGPNGELLPRKDFGFVTDLAKLATDKKIPLKVVPGKPLASEIIKRIDARDEGKMPDDYLETSSVSEKDRKAIVDWISSLANKSVASCDTDHFVSNKQLYQSIIADLDALPASKRQGTRYLSFANLYNRCIDDQSMQIYRMASVKLLNSLSRSADVLRGRFIGTGNVLLAFNIGELNWDEGDWLMIIASYPYGSLPDTVQAKTIVSEIGTDLGVIRADWFAENASRAPLYDSLLELPKTFSELQKKLKLDVIQNINQKEVLRAGFQHSEVSINANRLVERHRISSGYFWTSYDFKSSEGKRSLFSHPFGPGGDAGFQPDGGETIFSLPNGFQGYYLNDAAGNGLAKAPVEVVQDPDRFDKTVTNGISCMGCHASGMRLEVKDEIRSFVSENKGSFDKSLREIINSIHPLPEEMSRTLLADQKRFLDAEKNAGMDLSQLSGRREPINALVEEYRARVDASIAAAELGLKPNEFASAVEGANGEARTVGRRLIKGYLRRSEFEGVYRGLVSGLTDENFVSGTLELQPVPESEAPPFFKAGEALTAKAKFKEALSQYNLAIQADKNFAPAWSSRGLLNIYSHQDAKAALADCNEAIRLSDDTPNGFHCRAKLVREILICNSYLQRPGSQYAGPCLTFLKNILPPGSKQIESTASSQLLKEAKADADRAVALSPADTAIRLNRAELFQLDGSHSESIDDYTKVLELGFVEASVYIERGRSYSKLGDKDRAIKDCYAALQLEPNNESAKVLLQNLEKK